MTPIKAGQIEKGMYLHYKNEPYFVAEREFVNPGKGSAFCRFKLKNVRTGSVLKEVRKSQDIVDEIEVEDKECQFLYNDGESYIFMDSETYEQFSVPVKGLEDKGFFMREGDSFRIVMWNEEALDIKLPPKMVFLVTDAPEAIKGDTVTGATKMCTIETGLQVKVPIFIKENEKIMINTETKDYVERVNK